MSEQSTTTEAAATEAEATEQQTATEETKPTETVEFWKAKAREQEKRAKENAAAAKRLSEIEESQKSEAQKASERIAELEREVAESQRVALRSRISAETGVPSELLQGSDEDTIRASAQAALVWQGERKKQGNHVASEGKSGGAKSSTADQFAEFFENQLGG